MLQTQTNHRRIMAETKLSVHVYNRQYQTVQFYNYTLESADKFGGSRVIL